MSHTKRYWIVLAMGLLALGAAAPEAVAEEGSPESSAPQGMDECIVVDPYASPPHAEIDQDQCL